MEVTEEVLELVCVGVAVMEPVCVGVAVMELVCVRVAELELVCVGVAVREPVEVGVAVCDAVRLEVEDVVGSMMHTLQLETASAVAMVPLEAADTTMLMRWAPPIGST